MFNRGVVREDVARSHVAGVPFREVTVRSLVNHPTVSVLSGLALCVLGFAPALAVADDEPLPLFLTTSLSVEHDSNFSRTPEANSETVRSLGLAAGLNKAYGRQKYMAYGQLTQNKYNRYGDLLDNDGKNVNASFDTEIGANWRAGLGYRFNENLNAIQDNSSSANQRVIRNMRRYSDVNGQLQYGLSGRFAVTASVDRNKLTYSKQPTQDAEQSSEGLRVFYNPSDLLSFGFGPRWVSTDYPDRVRNRNVRDRSLDFTTNWRVTGISLLTGRLSYVKSQGSDDPESSSAFTGAMGWTYTPRGPVTYSVNWSRATDTDRLQESQVVVAGGSVYQLLNSVVEDRITNTLAFGARYKATAKVSFGANYRYVRYDSARARSSALPSSVSNRSSQSNYRTLALDVNYTPVRAVDLGCNWQRYEQTEDIFRLAHKGWAAGCNASFTID